LSHLRLLSDLLAKRAIWLANVDLGLATEMQFRCLDRRRHRQIRLLHAHIRQLRHADMLDALGEAVVRIGIRVRFRTGIGVGVFCTSALGEIDSLRRHHRSGCIRWQVPQIEYRLSHIVLGDDQRAELGLIEAV